MSDNTNKTTPTGNAMQESISAMVDDQVSELELRRILKQAEQDPQVYQDWERYQLVGAAMRGESVQPGNLLRGIQVAIADDGQQEDNQQGAGFWASLGKVTIAASVAAVVVMGAQQNWMQSPADLLDQNPTAATAQAQPKLNQQPIVLDPAQLRTVSAGGQQQRMVEQNPAPMLVPKQGLSQRNRNPAQEAMLRKHLQQLMQEHAANATANGGRGVLPYVRVPRVQDKDLEPRPQAK